MSIWKNLFTADSTFFHGKRREITWLTNLLLWIGHDQFGSNTSVERHVSVLGESHQHVQHGHTVDSVAPILETLVTKSHDIQIIINHLSHLRKRKKKALWTMDRSMIDHYYSLIVWRSRTSSPFSAVQFTYSVRLKTCEWPCCSHVHFTSIQ